MRTKFSGILTLLMAFMVQLTFAQEKTITGTVTDVESGMPLAGVNIVIEGTTTGTQTDFDGNYSIEASTGQTLVFTYVGYADKSVSVGSDTTIDVTMGASAADLGTVVVTAFGIERESKELSYATEEIEAEELTQAAPVNAVQALQGKASGLNIITKNNGVNPGTSIILRGYSSITSSNEALVVIDGVIQHNDALADLNPLDIASATILKGSSATALYGSAGANGAVIVTTKKGAEGKLNVNINSSITFERVSYFPEVQTKYGSGLDLHTYVAYENTQWGPRFDGQPRRIGRVLPDGSFQVVPYAPIEDNRKDFFQTGLTFSNGFNISGGDEKSSFYFSARRSDVTGTVPGDTYVKDNFRLNASRTEGDFTISTNVSFYQGKEDVHGASAGYQGRALYWNIINTPSNIPLTRYKNWRTEKFATKETYYNEYYQNPYMLIDIARDREQTQRLFGKIDMDYEFADWFTASYSLSGIFYNEHNKNTDQEVTYNPAIAPTRTGANTPAEVFEQLVTQQRITSQLILNFQKDFGEHFSTNLILGNTVKTYEAHATNVSATGLVVPGLYDVSVRTGELAGGNYAVESAKVGYYADLTVGYNDYLFLNGAYRYDKSSTLPLDNNGYSFYSAGLSAILTDAIPAIKGDVLNYFKINGSYSKVGNDPTIGYINELFAVPLDEDAVAFDVGVYNPTFPYSMPGFRQSFSGVSSSFEPEFKTSVEVGAEFGFFDNRINLKFAYFKDNTENQFISAGTSYASGISQVRMNSGEIENKGFEIDLGLTPIRNENIRWDINLNMSKIDNEVLALSRGTNRTQVGLASSQIGIYAQVGQSYPAVYGFGYQRDPQGRVIINPVSGNPQVTSDFVHLGQGTPDLILGGSTSFQYKSITLSATADYKTGHVYYNSFVNALEFSGSTVHSASSNRLPFVFPNSSYPDGNGGYVANTNILTSGGGFDFWNNVYGTIPENYVTDATTFKLREVALSYTLPDKFLDGTFLTSATFGIVGRNLIMLRSAENVYTDPEFTTETQEVTGIGTLAQLPPTRNYGFKLNLKF